MSEIDFFLLSLTQFAGGPATVGVIVLIFAAFFTLKKKGGIISAILITPLFASVLFLLLILMIGGGYSLSGTVRGQGTPNSGILVGVGFLCAVLALGTYIKCARNKRHEDVICGRVWAGMLNENILCTAKGLTVEIWDLPIQFNKFKNEKRLYENAAFQMFEYLDVQKKSGMFKELLKNKRVECNIRTESVVPYKIIISADDDYLRKYADSQDDDELLADVVGVINAMLSSNKIRVC